MDRTKKTQSKTQVQLSGNRVARPLARFMLRRLAPEIGFALEQMETLNAKPFGVSVVEQLDKLR